MKCIILDGWHKGQMLEMPELRAGIALIRPAHIIACDCDPYQPVNEFPQEPKIDIYALAFRSIDGETALYSRGGKSEAAWRDVGNLVRRERPIGLHTILIDCHDEQAWQD